MFWRYVRGIDSMMLRSRIAAGILWPIRPPFMANWTHGFTLLPHGDLNQHNAQWQLVYIIVNMTNGWITASELRRYLAYFVTNKPRHFSNCDIWYSYSGSTTQRIQTLVAYTCFSIYRKRCYFKYKWSTHELLFYLLSGKWSSEIGVPVNKFWIAMVH